MELENGAAKFLLVEEGALVVSACVVVDGSGAALAACAVDEAGCALTLGGTKGVGNRRLLYTRKKASKVYKASKKST